MDGDGEKKDDGRQNCSSSSCSQSQNKMQKNNSPVCLPDDAMLVILSKLPAQWLRSNARHISNSWEAMIHRSDFVAANLLRAKPGIFVQSTKHPYGARFLEIKDNGKFDVTTLNHHFPGRFLNSCDGLILLFHYATADLLVANPVTMKVLRVPHLISAKLMYPPCAIVRVPRTGEFKLFASVVLTQNRVCNSHWYVLGLGKDASWTKITEEAGDFQFRCTPIYTGGNDLFWITEERVIMVDVDTETFRQFPLPQGNHRWHPQYLSMGNCLASVIFLGELGFQIHKFDSNSGTWTLDKQIGGLDYLTGNVEVLSEFFSVWINEELIIKTVLVPTLMTLMFSYNVETGVLRKINAIEEGSFDVGLHTNSLVSWKTVIAID